MANKLCYLANDVLPRQIRKVKIATGQSFSQGDAIFLNTLDSASDNIEVYAATPIADVTTDGFGLVINQGVEELSDGRRISGNADPSTFTYYPEQTLTVAIPEVNERFFISEDCLDNTDSVALAAGVYLTGQNADYQLATASSYSTEKVVFYVEKLHSTPNGGQFGAGFIDGAYIKCIKA